MLIISPSFDNGALIPKKFTGDGGDINPELQIENVPPQAVSLALVLHDPDAPMPGGFYHWLVWNIDPRTALIKEESTPPGAVEGANGAGTIGYIGPKPPSGVHHYHFMLYALDDELQLPHGAAIEELKKSMDGHVVATAELVGVYGTSDTVIE
jgi:Raf kinase inhibitor-like YbhB/YbcL family protein